MKNTRALLMILVSLALGLIAVAVAGKWINEQTRVDASAVFVATRDIDAGTRLTFDMLKKTDWPSGSMPAGSFQDIEKLENRVLKTHLVAGEPVLESKLAPIGTSGGLSGVIAEGTLMSLYFPSAELRAQSELKLSPRSASCILFF